MNLCSMCGSMLAKIENKIQSKVGLVEQATLRYVDVNKYSDRRKKKIP